MYMLRAIPAEFRAFEHMRGKIADSTSGAGRRGHCTGLAAIRPDTTRHTRHQMEAVRLMPERSCKQPDHPSKEMLGERANLDRRGRYGHPERQKCGNGRGDEPAAPGR